MKNTCYKPEKPSKQPLSPKNGSSVEKNKQTNDDTTSKQKIILCNQCKYYEGVHNVQGVAPCTFWNSRVSWKDFCSRGEKIEIEYCPFCGRKLIINKEKKE